MNGGRLGRPASAEELIIAELRRLRGIAQRQARGDRPRVIDARRLRGRAWRPKPRAEE